MGVRRISIEAYRNIKENGLLSRRRFEVYSWLFENGPATATQIANGLRKQDTNSSNVRARLNEMRSMGCTFEVEEVKCEHTGQTVILWDCTEQQAPLKIHKKQTIIDKLKSRIIELEEEVRYLKNEANWPKTEEQPSLF